MFKLSPSVLSADFSRMADQVSDAERAGCEYLHLDVMDGHFVPNISFGSPVISSLRKVSRAVFDTHLMISSPGRYIKDFAAAGSDIITFHYEACSSGSEIKDIISLVRSYGKKCGISINPSTDPSVLSGILSLVDMVLVMSVQPGFSGQAFMPEALLSVAAVKKMRGEAGLNFDIEIDGGITPENVRQVLSAGADIIVAGSGIFGCGDIKAAAAAYRKAAVE